SRTGITDTSGICTMLLPEKLVVVFTPNHQSLTGVIEVISRAVEYRRTSEDLRPLMVLPLPSRIEMGEKPLWERWRLGDGERGIAGYQREFERAFVNAYGLTACDLGAYFDDSQVQ